MALLQTPLTLGSNFDIDVWLSKMDLLVDNISAETASFLRSLIDVITAYISPKLDVLNDTLEKRKLVSKVSDEADDKNTELFSLCKDQILKCSSLMADIIKREISNSCVMEESRRWVLNRILWCLDKLDQLEETVSKKCSNELKSSNLANSKGKLSDSLIDLNLFINDEFISWVDDSLDLLEVIEKSFQDENNGRTGQNKNTLKRNQWIKETSTNVINLHKIIRELIFSAMNICHNSLSQDQQIINARCHVVLRESKTLMSEIVLDSKFVINDCNQFDCSNVKIKDSLHFPTIRLFVTILKDAIHTLEACINRAVLGLVLKCLSDPLKPLNKIVLLSEKDIESSDEMDIIQIDTADADKSTLVKKFDVHSEQLTQIGLFAISCSADKQRVLQVKSCLASLEILDTHLVPTILSNPSGLHAQFLIDHWNHEINILRRCVFLIVDPAAFIDLVAEMSQEKISQIRFESPLKWSSTQPLIDLGKCVLDYFNSYFEYESQIFEQNKNLSLIMDNLKKVVRECQVVGDLFLMKPYKSLVKNKVNQLEKPTKEKKYQEQRVIKRLKLLYSLIVKVVKELNGDMQTLDDDDDESVVASPQNTYILNSSSQPKPSDLKVKLNTPPSERKGIFKIFDKLKLITKSNLNNADNASENKSYANENPFKTFSRTTIVRSAHKKASRQNNIDCEPISIEPIMARLNKANGKMHNVVLKDFISASGILDGLSDDYLLTDISNENILGNTRSLENTKKSIDASKSSKNRTNIFYNSKDFRGRQVSLRRKVLMNQANETTKRYNRTFTEKSKNSLSKFSGARSIESLNQSLDLHITEILEQLTKLSDTMSLMKIDDFDKSNRTVLHTQDLNATISKIEDAIEPVKNILTLKINESNHVSPKKVWNIKVSQEKENYNNISNIRATVDKENTQTAKVTNPSTPNKIRSNYVDCEIDLSFGSNVPTPERLNDLHQLELKLANLKEFWKK